MAFSNNDRLQKHRSDIKQEIRLKEQKLSEQNQELKSLQTRKIMMNQNNSNFSEITNLQSRLRRIDVQVDET